jgi:hypothetical protein
MNNRKERILKKAEEKMHNKASERTALLQKGASILDEMGAVGGGTLGGVGGMLGGAHLAKGLHGKYQVLAALLGGIGGATGGSFGGATLGQWIADTRRRKRNEEMLENAGANRAKAIADATAARAFNQAGLGGQAFANPGTVPYLPR